MEDFLEQLGQVGTFDSDNYQWMIEQHRGDVKLNNLLNAIESKNLAAESIDRDNNPHMASFYNAIAQARIDGTQKALRM